jgi:hypothetical protein
MRPNHLPINGVQLKASVELRVEYHCQADRFPVAEAVGPEMAVKRTGLI